MICRNCGDELKEGAKFCRKCGSEILLETETFVKNTCSKCGNLLKENAAFCNKCGQRVANEYSFVADNVRRCPNCNSPLNDGVVYCGNCGMSLKENVPQVSVQNTEKKNKNTVLIFFVVLLSVALVASTVVIGYLYCQNIFSETEVSDTDDKENVKEEKFENKEDDEEKVKEIFEEEESIVEEDISFVEDEAEDYIFPSDREYITEADLYGMTKEEVAMIRNEIYARHGYIFNTEPFKTYFESQYWYIPNENFNDSVFNEIEEANKDFLVEYEKSMGWR